MYQEKYLKVKVGPTRMLFSLIMMVCLMSCKSFIEVDAPRSELVSASVFESDASAHSTITAIYSAMNNDRIAYNIPFYTGMYGDELQSTGSSVNNAFYFNSLGTTTNTSSDIWNNSFKYIYWANSILEGVDKATNLKEQTKVLLKGESLFIRAFWYFYLVNLYGDVPLLLSTDYEANRQMPRTSSDLVYKQLASDLKQSITFLPEEYSDANGVPGVTERVRPNRSAAQALLARIYLYVGNYTEALNYAGLVINKKTLYDTVGLDNVFLKNSKEAIWQIPPSSTNATYNTQEGVSFIVVASRPVSPINPEWLNVFESVDKRKEKWVGKYVDASVPPARNLYFPYKYKNRNPSPVTEYSMILRLAEQYLIRAEARLQQTDIGGALSDLNVIRKRAGLPLSLANDKPTILNAIIHERRVELFCEWGHRWLDMKRYGIVNEIMNVVTPQKGGVWLAGKDLWPIAQTELDRNYNLVQNPVYK